jgi:hypothetical protein
MDVEWWATFRRDLDDEVVKRPVGVLARDLEDEIPTRPRPESQSFTESQDLVPLSVHRASSLVNVGGSDPFIETPAKTSDDSGAEAANVRLRQRSAMSPERRGS